MHNHCETLEEVVEQAGNFLLDNRIRLAGQIRNGLYDKRDTFEVTLVVECKDDCFDAFLKLRTNHRIATPLGFLRLEKDEREDV